MPVRPFSVLLFSSYSPAHIAHTLSMFTCTSFPIFTLFKYYLSHGKYVVVVNKRLTRVKLRYSVLYNSMADKC